MVGTRVKNNLCMFKHFLKMSMIHAEREIVCRCVYRLFRSNTGLLRAVVQVAMHELDLAGQLVS